MKLSPQSRGFSLVELMFTVALIGVLGLLIYSILYTSSVLGAKNTAMNVAHEQARVAMMEMLQDLHSSVSLPALANSSGVPYASPAPANAEGIAFQEWGSGTATVNGKQMIVPNGGPHKLVKDVNTGDTQITISVTPVVVSGQTVTPTPAPGQHLIIPSYQIEADIKSIDNSSVNNLKMTLMNIYGPALTPSVAYPTSSIPLDINGTGSTGGDVVCFITDRCSYTVANTTLSWNWKSNIKNIGNYITNTTPFSTPTTPAGALYYRFVAAIDLSTSDLQYSNRGYKSANILLNGQVPMKARLTTYQ
jgi:prepilin-type N-terminal cleavage/methylation domain-containing protein